MMRMQKYASQIIIPVRYIFCGNILWKHISDSSDGSIKVQFLLVSNAQLFLRPAHTLRKSRNITGQNRSSISWYVVEQYGQRIKIMHGCLQKNTRLGFHYFFIMFYCTISTTYQRIGDLFCPVHISGLSHCVSLGTIIFMWVMKLLTRG